MSKKIILLVLLSLSLISCKKNDTRENNFLSHELPKQLVEDKAIYEFLNYNLKLKDSAFPICQNILNREIIPYWSTEDSLTLLKMDTIFSRADVKFIFKQAEYSKYFKLKEDKLLSKKIIDIDTSKIFTNDVKLREDYWDNLNAQFGTICMLTMPLFSMDKKTVIIKTGYYCGMLCGEGGTYIYRKIDEKWIRIKTLDAWVS